jgi:uncharacterized membrane protein
MDIVLVLLRLIHILAAVAWVGVGLTQVIIIGPAMAAAGDSGLRFAKALGNVPAYRMVFSVAGGLTVLAGILLYLTGSASRFSQLGNIVLGIGALAGIAAAVHGGAVTGRSAQALGQLIATTVPDSGAIPADALAKIRAAAAEQATHTRVSFILMLIALIGMGTARYL